MRQRKSKIVILYLFLFFFVGSVNNLNLNNFNISKIENIKISGLSDVNNQIILEKIKDLNLKNIFFLNQNEIIKILNSNTLIENFKVFKKYPSELDIYIEKTEFLAKINKDGKEYLIGSNRKFSKSTSSIQNLPYIFGNPKISEFLNLKKTLDKSPIPYDEIKNLYFFQSKRWDLEMKNNLLIKLPAGSIQNILGDVSVLLSKNNLSNFKIIDARVKNQIIVNE